MTLAAPGTASRDGQRAATVAPIWSRCQPFRKPMFTISAMQLPVENLGGVRDANSIQIYGNAIASSGRLYHIPLPY